MSEYTTILFARPSFLEGTARLLDYANTLQVYNVSVNEADADTWALMSDWYAIGEDMKRAVSKITQSRTMADEDEQTESK